VAFRQQPGGPSNKTWRLFMHHAGIKFRHARDRRPLVMYAKVFRQILDSSISEDYLTRHVFMDLLLLADPKGIVDMTPQSIARATNVPLQIVTDAIKKLMEPDLDSRSNEDDGRRLILLDPPRTWGWIIVNFQKYRSIQNEESRREYHKHYDADRYREKRKLRPNPCNDSNNSNIVQHVPTIPTIPTLFNTFQRFQDKQKQKQKQKQKKTLVQLALDVRTFCPQSTTRHSTPWMKFPQPSHLGK
jgi:hypothetical protein